MRSIFVKIEENTCHVDTPLAGPAGVPARFR